MEIKFSRNCKRRMKLYRLSKKDIEIVIQNGKKTSEKSKSNYFLKIPHFNYPIKVVTETKKDYILVITEYPLKRELRK